ncbi:T9SS type A sorting domain-containing protein, partial [bacterium]|nr:T9SS type A sorting domain-containing protein [bacterium]
DVDLLAIQEVDNINDFEQMVDSLNSYEGYLESLWFAGLAYIYNTDVIQVNDIYEIYTTSQYWSPFPRSPMVMDLNFVSERIIVINNHFKCCGNGIMDTTNPDDEETRRFYATNLLKEYIDIHFPDENVIVLGDLNDVLSDSPENNVFQLVLDDVDNYLFTDYEIAMGDVSNWSYPTWPSHLDHILVTNELFDDFENESSVITTIKIDEYLTGGWWEYDTNISDHRPVALKLEMNSNLGISDLTLPIPHFSNYPNPFNPSTTIQYELPELSTVVLSIYDIRGREVRTLLEGTKPPGSYEVQWNGVDNSGNPVSTGVYFCRLQAGSYSKTIKMVYLK